MTRRVRQYWQRFQIHFMKLAGIVGMLARKKRMQFIAIVAILLPTSAALALDSNHFSANIHNDGVQSFTESHLQGVHAMNQNANDKMNGNHTHVSVNTDTSVKGDATNVTTHSNSVSISAGSSGADVVINGKHIKVPPNGSYHYSKNDHSDDDKDDSTTSISSRSHVTTHVSGNSNAASVNVNISENSSSSAGESP